MNAIPQKTLEEAVIKGVLDSYKHFLNKGGRKKLAEAVKDQIGSEDKEFIKARKRAQLQINNINKTINNLLDNITSSNRDLVDQRLGELRQEKHQLQARLEELDRLSLSQGQINGIVSDSMKFLAGLEFVLLEGIPQEKLVALRRCIKKISINKPASTLKLTMRSVPVGNLEITKELQVIL